MEGFPVTNGVQRNYSCIQNNNFQHFTSRYTKVTGHELVNMGYVSWPISRKRLKKKQNAIYRDPSTAHAEFNSKYRSKIGSLYEEIFQHKGTVPNDKIGQVRVTFR